ncbi:MAG: NAD kinase [Bacteroidales bacterium]|nr:NAD kinase [Hoylesella loescheii]MCI6723853.1 NAD kinase [Bacteroidales bacterium]MDY3356716.1 NAD kinase [Prevotella sp.]MCI7561283.1 NAD kinase [Bacteroidales bacterium]MCI7763745.1 NAD kinase [Bacteroidales bacterium]
MTKKLRFAIFGNEYQRRKSASAQQLLECLSRRQAVVYIEEGFCRFLSESQHVKADIAGTFRDLDFDIDYVISMGGDGTLLKAASKVGARSVPIIGINMGRLGYLADVPATDIEEAIERLYSGDYVTENHSVIEATAMRGSLSGCPRALNDIAVLKQDNASMITIHARIDGKELITYQADGLIISTPTGSTAYSLSNGGPIIMPATDVLCLTPVAPHSLSVRPIVVPAKAEITLTVESRSHNYLVAIDGRSEKLPERTTLRIRRAPYEVKIVKRHGGGYITTLRGKMMWGADAR